MLHNPNGQYYKYAELKKTLMRNRAVSPHSRTKPNFQGQHRGPIKFQAFRTSKNPENLAVASGKTYELISSCFFLYFILL